MLAIHIKCGKTPVSVLFISLECEHFFDPPFSPFSSCLSNYPVICPNF
jgi:hypothetical protein